MEKRRRLSSSEKLDGSLGDDDDLVDVDGCDNSEEQKDLEKVVDSFFQSSFAGVSSVDDEKRKKLEKKLRERRLPPPVQPVDVGDVVHEDFDDELSFLFREAMDQETKDIRKIDALYAKNLPYLS